MFLGLTNFYKRFIQNFSKITAQLISMLKIMASSVPARLASTKTNKNDLVTDHNNGIGGGRINDKIANLSSFKKKMSFGASFLTPKARLTFTQ